MISTIHLKTEYQLLRVSGELS